MKRSRLWVPCLSSNPVAFWFPASFCLSVFFYHCLSVFPSYRQSFLSSFFPPAFLLRNQSKLIGVFPVAILSYHLSTSLTVFTASYQPYHQSILPVVFQPYHLSIFPPFGCISVVPSNYLSVFPLPLWRTIYLSVLPLPLWRTIYPSVLPSLPLRFSRTINLSFRLPVVFQPYHQSIFLSSRCLSAVPSIYLSVFPLSFSRTIYLSFRLPVASLAYHLSIYIVVIPAAFPTYHLSFLPFYPLPLRRTDYPYYYWL
jgi:hypothetical protein